MGNGMSKAQDANEPRKSAVREYLESIVVAVILALFIRTFIVQAFKIPTGSMEKNLLVGDHLLVNKLIYSPSLAPWEDKLLAKRPVQRGDVVVFKFPEDPSRDFIKRVIGLPGETVAVRGKGVYVNGKLLHETYTTFIADEGREALAAAAPPPAEKLEDAPDSDGIRPPFGPEVVPAGKVFVLGDNRDNSRDSRFWRFLPLDQIKGRALLVYWSYTASREEYNRTGTGWIKDTLTAIGKTRWDRFFHLIR
jgi:signal peptidase I